MNFQLNGSQRTIELVEIKKDGDCLFGAMVHQIYGYIPNSAKHLAAVAELRKDVVKHIVKNFDFYKFQIYGRLYEERDDTGLILGDDLDKQSRDFVLGNLAEAGTFGGAESLKAISDIHKINIISFNEAEKFFFYMDFNPTYKRTAAIAFRLSHRPDKPPNHRNHYDSVSEVGKRIIFGISVALAKIEKEKCSLNETDIIDLLSI